MGHSRKLHLKISLVEPTLTDMFSEQDVGILPLTILKNSLLTVAVHLFVVVHVLTADDRLPPGLVVEIPLDRLLDAVGKLGFRQPAEFGVNLGRVDGVAHVVTLAVGNEGDKRVLRVAGIFDCNSNHFLSEKQKVAVPDSSVQ